MGKYVLLESYLSLIAATALLLGSPGPAPLALAATGATFGFKQGMPFLLGILLGLSVVIVGATLGLASLFSALPQLRLICQLLGAAYILYIAYKIVSAGSITNKAAQVAPGFRDGFILNLLNPKAYAAFLAIFSQFLLPIADVASSYLLTGFICLLVATIVDLLWLSFGGLLKPLLAQPKQAKVIRIVFALLMIGAVMISLLRVA